jgi:hypothetical protein
MDNKGFSVLMATLLTVIVLMVLGGAMYLMATEVTPSGNPMMGALSCTRNNPGNYTISIIGLTNYGVDRNDFRTVVQPNNMSTYVSNITGYGQHLGQGDSFVVGELQPGTTYWIYIIYKPTGDAIASVSLVAQ